MKRNAMGLVCAMAMAPLLGCYAAEGAVDEARDRALGGTTDGLEAAAAETVELMEALAGYYVIEHGRQSDGALESLWLGQSYEVAIDGTTLGESRRRAAGPCEAYDCGFVIGDTYRVVPETFGINAAYLLLDAQSDSPTAFYIIRHIERDHRGEIVSLELRYSPDPDTVGDAFVMSRWDSDPDLRPDLDIETMSGLPGHFVREDAQPAADELVSVQFGIDEASGEGEQGGSFIRQVNISCSSAGCTREAGDRYLAAPRNFLGISKLVFHEGSSHEDVYIVDEVVRDAVGTIVRMSVRHWGDDEMGQPFSLARLGYAN